MISVLPSSYGCTWEFAKHSRSYSLTLFSCLATSRVLSYLDRRTLTMNQLLLWFSCRCLPSLALRTVRLLREGFCWVQFHSIWPQRRQYPWKTLVTIMLILRSVWVIANLCPGARFSKVPKTFRPEKPFVKLRPAYSVKLVFSSVVKGIKIKITAQFRGSRRLPFEDTKIIMSPEMRRDFRENGSLKCK